MAYYQTVLTSLFICLAFTLVITLRWFSYKERMALIAQGKPPREKQDTEQRYKMLLASGLILSFVGFALSIGMITLGIGPWLLLGLLPLFLGLAMILTSLITRPDKPKKETAAGPAPTFEPVAAPEPDPEPRPETALATEFEVETDDPLEQPPFSWDEEED